MLASYLERSAGQNQTITSIIVLTQHHVELGLCVLETVALVNNHVLPLDLRQHRPVLDDVVKRRQQHLEVPVLDLLLLDVLADIRRALVANHRDGRRPLFEFKRPVGECR